MELVEHAAARAQRRLWFVEQLTPGEPLHNIAFQVDCAGRLDPEALRAALDDVVDRHESLRTRLVQRSGTLRQVVLDRLDGRVLTTVDCPDEAEADRRAAAWAVQPFDLAQPPLLRVGQLRRPAPAGDRLVVVVHHAVSDAWSIGVLLGDLTAAYRARLAGRAPDWSPPPVQYVDFTAWQEQQLDGAEARADLAYWEERLADLPALDLTSGRGRPTDAGSAGSVLELEIAGDDAARLAAFAAEQHATTFMVLLAAYVAALGRVFGSEDVAVGTSVAGRPLPELAGLVGLFVDRQVLRVGLQGAPSFRTLVDRARAAVLGAAEHGTVTFDRIVERLAPEREYGVVPLAQASINMHPPLAHGGLARIAGGTADPHDDALAVSDGKRLDTGTVPHDLALDLVDTGSCYRGDIAYRHGVVDEGAARRVVDLFVRLLRAGLAEPDEPLWTVPSMSDDEAARLTALGDGGPAAGPDTPVVDLLDEWARRTPDAVAVRDPEGTLTYAQLRAAVDDTAHRLRAAGVRAESAVPVAMPWCVPLLVALYAVQRAGGAYVPVDPAAPAGHLAELVAGLDCPVALVRDGDTVALPDTVRRLSVRAEPPVPADPGPPTDPPLPAQAGYVLFTSGSTGAPKGVLVEHRNIAGYVHGLLSRLRPPPGARYLMVQAPTFDSAGTMVYAALATGGELDLVSADVARDPAALAAHVADHPVDYLKITPSHLAALLGDGDAGWLRPRGAVVLGGEAAARALTDRLRADDWPVFVHYGPTESTVGVLADWLTDDLAGDLPGVPLGRPLPGTRVRVLDGYGQPVPVGTVGELVVSGAQVARGYLGAPGRTAESFVPVPGGGRGYRTGDLVRPLASGGYQFQGRADRQLKVNGHRIEPAAVERALLRHPDVSAAAVVAHRSGGTARLAGYVVVTDPDAADVDAIRATAAGTLPTYAVPADVLAVRRLPMTRHGKLDVAALPAPSAPAGGEADAPVGDTEHELLAVYRDVLGRDDIGVTDDFFVAGGDSVQAISVVGAARRRGLAVAGRDLFAAPTVRALAARLAAAEAAAPPDAPGRSGAAEPPDTADRPDGVAGGDGASRRFADAGLDEDDMAQVLASLGLKESS